MSWKDCLEKLKLVDIQSSLDVDQAGFVNVKVDNHHYHFHFPDADSAKAFQAAQITPSDETAIKEGTRVYLEQMDSTLSTVSESAMKEVVVATSTTSAISYVKKK